MDSADAFMPASIEPPDRPLPYFRALRTALDNPVAGWPRAIYQSPIYAQPHRHFPLVYVCDPEALRIVLVERAEDFPKAPLWLRLLRPMLGQGILTSEGRQWRWQRQAAAPAFQPKHLLSCAAPMLEAGERAVRRWRGQGDDQVLDIAAEMIRITFEVILDTMLGGRDGHDIDAMSREFANYVADLGKPTLADVAGAPAWLRGLAAPRAMAAVRHMRAAAEAMIARRRAGAARDDLFEAMLNARDAESGRAMSDADIRDNLLTFLAGGHETTALTLTWAIYLLSHHPDAQSRVRQEVERAATKGVGAVMDPLADLPFTKQVVQETLRLYPAFPALSRVCRKSCTLSGRVIRAGEIVVIPIYALHRHALYWNQPDLFQPDRFAPASGLDRRRYIYMPFGGGQRVCIGAAFAMMEATLLLAHLLRAASFEPIASHAVQPVLRITLRPDGGLPTRVKLLAKSGRARSEAAA
jgi:cytochrome P450